MANKNDRIIEISVCPCSFDVDLDTDVAVWNILLRHHHPDAGEHDHLGGDGARLACVSKAFHKSQLLLLPCCALLHAARY